MDILKSSFISNNLDGSINALDIADEAALSASLA